MVDGLIVQFHNLLSWQVDAFVWDNLRGNPAAVILLSKWKDDKWLQDVATEFNLSQTAFIVKKEKTVIDSKDDSNAVGDAQFDLRWLTPVGEVSFDMGI